MKKIPVKKIHPLFVFLKILPPSLNIGLYPNVYLGKELYENYQTIELEFETLQWYFHEEDHIRRQEKIGLLKWALLYFLSDNFCFEEEVSAARAEMWLFKRYNKEFPINARAIGLSTFWFYHRCTSYAKARKRLEEEWAKIKSTDP